MTLFNLAVRDEFKVGLVGIGIHPCSSPPEHIISLPSLSSLEGLNALFNCEFLPEYI